MAKIMKHVEILLMEEGDLHGGDLAGVAAVDVGQTKPAGNIEIREFEDGEWMGGSYATYENLVEKVKEALEITAGPAWDDDKSLMWEPEDGGEG